MSEILENSPAYKAGLLPGDLIIAVNDNKIENFNELRNYIEINEYLELEILRKSNLITIKLKPTFDKNCFSCLQGGAANGNPCVKFSLFHLNLSIRNFYLLWLTGYFLGSFDRRASQI